MGITIDCYLDRFEGDFAVLLVEGQTLTVPRQILPPDATEGDYLSLSMAVDKERRRAVEQKISELQDRLRSKENEK